MECSKPQTKTEPILTLENVSITLQSKTIINKISLSINHGDIISIIGPNGAGKSTLLKAISDSSNSYSGSIHFNKRNIKQWTAHERAKHIAVLPQNSILNFPYLVEDVVALGRIPHATGNLVDSRIVLEVMEHLKITHLAERAYTQLSGGEQRRTQLARVLSQIWRKTDSDPRLLILDEPVTALDLGHQQQLMKLIKDFSLQGVTVIMVLHDINLACQFSDKVIALSSGNLIAQGEPENVLTKAVIHQLFGAEIHLIKHPVTGKTVLVS